MWLCFGWILTVSKFTKLRIPYNRVFFWLLSFRCFSWLWVPSDAFLDNHQHRNDINRIRSASKKYQFITATNLERNGLSVIESLKCRIQFSVMDHSLNGKLQHVYTITDVQAMKSLLRLSQIDNEPHISRIINCCKWIAFIDDKNRIERIFLNKEQNQLAISHTWAAVPRNDHCFLPSYRLETEIKYTSNGVARAMQNVLIQVALHRAHETTPFDMTWIVSVKWFLGGFWLETLCFAFRYRSKCLHSIWYGCVCICCWIIFRFVSLLAQSNRFFFQKEKRKLNEQNPN